MICKKAYSYYMLNFHIFNVKDFESPCESPNSLIFLVVFPRLSKVSPFHVIYAPHFR